MGKLTKTSLCQSLCAELKSYRTPSNAAALHITISLVDCDDESWPDLA